MLRTDMTFVTTLAATLAFVSPADISSAQTAGIEIHRHAASGAGSVNTYLIETDASIVVLDTQRQISVTTDALYEIKTIGKPVTHIIVSHAHPDHFGGINAFKEAFPDAKVVMDVQSAKEIAEDTNGFSQMGLDFFGADFSARPQADVLLNDNDELIIDGVRFLADVQSNTEAPSILMIAVPEENVLFSSDLVAHEMHPFFVEAEIANWRTALDNLGKEYTGYTVFPGHGASGDASGLFTAQVAYIDAVTSIVDTNAGTDNVLSPNEKAASVTDISESYPGWADVTGRSDILELNFDAIASQIFKTE